MKRVVKALEKYVDAFIIAKVGVKDVVEFRKCMIGVYIN